MMTQRTLYILMFTLGGLMLTTSLFATSTKSFETLVSKPDTLYSPLFNVRTAYRGDVVLVVCGSAASWMLHTLIHHKGGLHNRLTLNSP